MVFWGYNGTVSGNEITNTYSEAATEQTPTGVKLLNIGPGSGIENGLVDIRFGPPRPPVSLDRPPVSLDERASLRQQLLGIAERVEMVMAPWES